MRHLIVAAIASVSVASFVAPGTAKAQVPRPPIVGGSGSPYGGQTLSPYLNLLQRGNPAINYYGLVRPQQGYNFALNSLEQQVTASRIAAAAAENQAAPSTGHQVSFLNYRRFFLNTGAAAQFQNVGASAQGLGAGSLPVGTGVGAPAARPGIGGYGGAFSNPYSAGAYRRY